MNNIRCEYISRLQDMPIEYSKIAIEAFDFTIKNYDFTPKETHLSTEVYKGLPEIDLYLGCQAVEGHSKVGLKNRRLVLLAMDVAINKQLKDINALDIRGFLYSYKQQRNISDCTLDKYRSYLSSFFNWCVTEHLLDSSPMANIKPIKYEKSRRNALTQLELEKLRKECRTPKEKCILEMLYSTGCRVSELANLKIEDVDFSDNSAVVHGKGKKIRKVFLNAKAVLALKDYWATRKDDCPYALLNDRRVNNVYVKITAKVIQAILTRIVLRSGLTKKITPHTLRHTTATISLENGMPLESIQLLLGHSSPATTLIYTDINLNKVHNEHIRCVI